MKVFIIPQQDTLYCWDDLQKKDMFHKESSLFFKILLFFVKKQFVIAPRQYMLIEGQWCTRTGHPVFTYKYYNKTIYDLKPYSL